MSSNPAQLVSDLRLFCGFMWFSLGTLVFPTNKIDRHDIAELLLKVALNTIKKTQKKQNNHRNINKLWANIHILALKSPRCTH
jgi:hypothetical protein